MSEHFNNADYQTALINCMISDQTSYLRVQNIVEPDFFQDKLRPVVRMIKEHVDEYKALPAAPQIKAMTGFKFEPAPMTDAADVDWFLAETEKFCRHRAIERVILNGSDLLEKGEAGSLERMLKEALTISLVTDLGTSFFDNVKERIERRRDRSNYVSTGWRAMDKKLGGGFTRGSLNIFAGGSGSGKSLFLQNIALNWVSMGMNVVYITLELSEDLVSERLEAMLSQVHTTELIRNSEQVALKIANIRRGGKGAKQAGDLHVLKMPESGATSNDIKAYLKEYQIKTGKTIDGLVIDYLDLMHPNNAKIDVSNMFTKDKYVSEEMRSIGSEWEIPVVSASQLNRQATEAQEYDHSHIAGGISKINTADNVFGIFTSLTMRQSGKYQVQFLKTRSAAATGHKIDLGYDFDCMRISDMPDEEVEFQQDNAAQNNAAVTSSQTASAANPVFSSKADEQRNDLAELMRKFQSGPDK